MGKAARDNSWKAVISYDIVFATNSNIESFILKSSTPANITNVIIVATYLNYYYLWYPMRDATK